MDKLQKKGDAELVELIFLRKNYKRLMYGLDLHKEHEEFEKKKKIKVARKIKKKKFDRVLMDSIDNAASNGSSLPNLAEGSL